MKQAAKNFEFEKAAQFRDRLKKLREQALALSGPPESDPDGVPF
jgi:excinuclease UvrABC helicase subunit UvrB